MQLEHRKPGGSLGTEKACGVFLQDREAKGRTLLLLSDGKPKQLCADERPDLDYIALTDIPTCHVDQPAGDPSEQRSHCCFLECVPCTSSISVASGVGRMKILGLVLDTWIRNSGGRASRLRFHSLSHRV